MNPGDLYCHENDRTYRFLYAPNDENKNTILSIVIDAHTPLLLLNKVTVPWAKFYFRNPVFLEFLNVTTGETILLDSGYFESMFDSNYYYKADDL